MNTRDEIADAIEAALRAYKLTPNDRCAIYGFESDWLEIVKALRVPASEYVPSEPTHDMLKALAGDPAILAASDEEELRKRYAVMLLRISGSADK